jgi:glycerate dehydrogenase
MKLVVLDGYTTNPGDLSWSDLEKLGSLDVYPRSTREEAIWRIEDAQGIFVNAVGVDREMMARAKNLEYIGVLSTGYNSIDLEAAREKGIAVTNVPDYSTEAVAQHAISLLLELSNQVGIHNQAIQDGKWYEIPDDCFWVKPLTLLAGKSIGIVGSGKIGTRVGIIAKALGMEVIIYSKDPQGARLADVLSLHCPLTQENREMINMEFIGGMKDGAFLINTARGGLVNENDLAQALKSGMLGGAALDVLTVEPPIKENLSPLIGLDNCIITPHHAWMPLETRKKLIEISAGNLSAYLGKQIVNRVDIL